MTAIPPVSDSSRPEPRPRQLVINEDQEALRTAVRDLLSDHASWASVLARAETDAPYDISLWERLSHDLGVTGLLIPEEFGGAGGNARDLAVISEQLGAFVAPVPFLGSAVLATAALVAVRSEPVASELLRRLAGGETTATLGISATTVPGGVLSTTVQSVGGLLTGTVTPVVDLAAAEHIIVLTWDEGEPALYAIAPDAATAVVSAITPLDLTRPIGGLELAAAPGRLIVRGDPALAAVATALVTGAAMLAAEQIGVAQWALDTTVAYLKDRHQFGRPIGSFQALKHRMAQVWRRVGLARAAALAAADALAGESDPDEIARVVAVAASYCSETSVFATEEMIQLHGGIGMTWEHPAHLYLGRAKADELILGAPDQHRTRLADLVGLPGS
ncbi:MAG: acyl-CoA/acyl-ACP dehydrogenase [Actinomycetota bacterium]|nr:acyl-CoA/acyl-ACP dehydrogenase [Actinomycetota bacterium]